MTQENLFNDKPMDDTAQGKIVDSGSVEGRIKATQRKNSWSSIDQRTKEFPKLYRGHYLRGMKGDSRRAAIRTNCLMCMGYHLNDVENCTAMACPLFPYRMRG
jgi:hypothetical protein